VSLRQLQILHAAEALNELPPAFQAAARTGEALVLHTCQRIMVLSCREELQKALRAQLPSSIQAETCSGVAAYELLLRLACGLESKLAGETEVFGQFKQCWQEFQAARFDLAGHVSGLMQNLFRDVKDIRSRYLTGTGSASYGSLVRRVLNANAGSSAAAANAPVLLVGAGQLAQSVAPWLKHSELWIWNRSAERAEALAEQLRQRDAERVVRVLPSTFEAELAAWRAARDVIVCVPADHERDVHRVDAWSHPRGERGRVIHLGFSDVPVADSGDTHWAGVDPLLHLGHLYEMLRASNEQRAAQLEQARRACADKALQAIAPRPAMMAAYAERSAGMGERSAARLA
jgi:glutamyl-tRNA reductase